MPEALLRYCAAPSCSNLVTKGRCPQHSTQQRANRAGHRWYGLAKWYHPAYGLRWRTLRTYPLCVDCLAEGKMEPSTEVDHVIPHRGNARLFWDPANLRGLCRRHHSEKTRREG